MGAGCGDVDGVSEEGGVMWNLPWRLGWRFGEGGRWIGMGLLNGAVDFAWAEIGQSVIEFMGGMKCVKAKTDWSCGAARTIRNKSPKSIELFLLPFLSTSRYR